MYFLRFLEKKRLAIRRFFCDGSPYFNRDSSSARRLVLHDDSSGGIYSVTGVTTAPGIFLRQLWTAAHTLAFCATSGVCSIAEVSMKNFERASVRSTQIRESAYRNKLARMTRCVVNELVNVAWVRGGVCRFMRIDITFIIFSIVWIGRAIHSWPKREGVKLSERAQLIVRARRPMSFAERIGGDCHCRVVKEELERKTPPCVVLAHEGP